MTPDLAHAALDRLAVEIAMSSGHAAADRSQLA
jgi:hypothetical protein